MLNIEPPMTVLAALGRRQMTALKEDAVALSSSAIIFIKKVSASGLDMFMSIALTT